MPCDGSGARWCSACPSSLKGVVGWRQPARMHCRPLWFRGPGGAGGMGRSSSWQLPRQPLQ
eukprot:8114386-Lingulodinium_polyedra.AAC.1